MHSGLFKKPSSFVCRLVSPLQVCLLGQSAVSLCCWGAVLDAAVAFTDYLMVGFLLFRQHSLTHQHLQLTIGHSPTQQLSYKVHRYIEPCFCVTTVKVGIVTPPIQSVWNVKCSQKDLFLSQESSTEPESKCFGTLESPQQLYDCLPAVDSCLFHVSGCTGYVYIYIAHFHWSKQATKALLHNISKQLHYTNHTNTHTCTHTRAHTYTHTHQACFVESNFAHQVKTSC